jgi:hypothetical protein
LGLSSLVAARTSKAELAAPERLRPHPEVLGALEVWERAAMAARRLPEAMGAPLAARAARVVGVVDFAISLVAAMLAPTLKTISTIAVLVAISVIPQCHFAIKAYVKPLLAMVRFAARGALVVEVIAVNPANYVAMFLGP